MILSFKGQLAEDIFNDRRTGASRRFPQELWEVAARKLQFIDAATDIRDLLSPPGNRLKRLTGRLSNCYSIRINDQFRIVFRWERGWAFEVEIIDYH